MTWVAAGVAVAGAVYSGTSQRKAAESQEKQMKEQLAFQKRVYAEGQQNLNPYIHAGSGALNQFQLQMGLGGEGKAFDVTQLPGYQNALQQGMGAVNQGGGGSGMLMSGDRLKGLQSSGQNIFGDYYNNYMSRLESMQNRGVGAASSLAGQGQGMAGVMANTASHIGGAGQAGNDAYLQGGMSALGSLSSLIKPQGQTVAPQGSFGQWADSQQVPQYQPLSQQYGSQPSFNSNWGGGTGGAF